MMGRIPDCVNNPSRLCPMPDFLEQVQYELDDPRWRQECFFNGSVRPLCLRPHTGSSVPVNAPPQQTSALVPAAACCTAQYLIL